MKPTYRFFVPLIVGVVVSLTAQAQDNMANLFKEGIPDGKYLLNGYLSPFAKSVSLGLNQGWYNTAKPHKVAGFDITVTLNGMFIPESDLFYTVDNTQLDNIELVDPSNGQAPTIFGPDVAPQYQLKNTTETFSGPPGVDLKGNLKSNMFPVPIANVGFGLPKDIDLKIRYSPTINIGDDGKFNLFGIGVLHDVKQYIPGIKLLPFNLSAFVGYTRMKVQYDLSGNFDSNNTEQLGTFEINATTIQGLISKQFSVITFYGGMGYNIAKSNLSMTGSYDFDENGTINSATEKDPVDLRFAASGPRMTAGFRLKLGVIALHTDYTLQKYKALTVGFGINVR